MSREFHQIEWDDTTRDDCRAIVRLAVREDLRHTFDWTTVSLVDIDRQGQAHIVSRDAGIVCGLRAAQLVIEETNASLRLTPHLDDGDATASGQRIATLEGSARDLLTTERLILNFIGHLSGISTKTRKYVDAIDGTKARIFDTRKTTPGWRRMEKYAVRCGGGSNHRTGLYDAILIKDNHLALSDQQNLSPADSVLQARRFLANWSTAKHVQKELIIEVEVDTLEQFANVLETEPDIVLLDNMPPSELKVAVAMRDEQARETTLEASGGVNLDTVRAIAESGVDRISVGALTHTVSNFDVGLDWVS